jgi:hypothetical protein
MGSTTIQWELIQRTQAPGILRVGIGTWCVHTKPGIWRVFAYAAFGTITLVSTSRVYLRDMIGRRLANVQVRYIVDGREQYNGLLSITKSLQD